MEKKTEEPWAYAVYCPKGHEFDYLVFIERQDAENEVCDQDIYLEGGALVPKIIPLYPRE